MPSALPRTAVPVRLGAAPFFWATQLATENGMIWPGVVRTVPSFSGRVLWLTQAPGW